MAGSVLAEYAVSSTSSKKLRIYKKWFGEYALCSE